MEAGAFRERGRYCWGVGQKCTEYLRRGHYSEFAQRCIGYSRACAKAALTPAMKYVFQGRQFIYGKEVYQYSIFPYNCTWNNERAVELSIIDKIADSVASTAILEIGNVMSHYGKGGWLVVDKYEKGDSILNEDILTLSLGRRFSRIISVSTLEHVGFDEPSQDASALPKAVKRAASHLTPDGVFVATLPVGYNPWVDLHLRDGSSGFTYVKYLVRTGLMRWQEGSSDDALDRRYNSPFECANAIAIGYKMGTDWRGY